MNFDIRTALLAAANQNTGNYKFGSRVSFKVIWYLDGYPYDVTRSNYYPDKREQQATGRHEWFHASNVQAPPDWRVDTSTSMINLVSGTRTQIWDRRIPGTNKFREYASVAYGDGVSWLFVAKMTDAKWYRTEGPAYVQRIFPVGIEKISDDLYRIRVHYQEWEIEDTPVFPGSPTSEDWAELVSWGASHMGGNPISDYVTDYLDDGPEEVVPPKRKDCTYSYKHNELHNYRMFKEFGIIANFYSSGYAQAYVDMCDDIPKFHGNQIANAMECVDALIGIFTAILAGNFAKAVCEGITNLKDLRNLYLAWRYSYNTTKSDVSEAQSTIARMRELDNHELFHIRGSYIHGDALFRCSAMVSLDELFPDIDKMSEWIDKVGLEINAERAWDIVPFSFMIDWILHISDWLHQLETIKKYGATLKMSDVWVSCRTKYDEQTCYMRHNYQAHARDLPMLPVPSWSASNKTFFMRVGDVISIFSK